MFFFKYCNFFPFCTDIDQIFIYLCVYVCMCGFFPRIQQQTKLLGIELVE
jgi:hypothetical protein